LTKNAALLRTASKSLQKPKGTGRNKIRTLAKPDAFLKKEIKKTAPLIESIHGVRFFFVAGSLLTDVNISFAWIKKTSKNQSSCHLHRYLN
jgi:5-methylcytosine-specific restriction endonuclease McrBC GTP-binding regulatory subunit McrB